MKKEIDEKLPEKVVQSKEVTKMEGEQPVHTKKDKFKREEAIANFKQAMGLGLGSIRAQLLQKGQ